ncbi:MAG: hypothetical protein JF567_07795 [Xanthomonadales bacterium]|nr:hypothetical protein [Xanthomonadales bacterium]
MAARTDHRALLALILSISTGSAGAAPLQSMPASAMQQPATNEPGQGTQDLPEDVRGYILRHRMCAHFQKEASTGDAGARATGKNMAKSFCPGADAATWKKLVRKYEGKDPIPGILLAERPAGIEMDTSQLK